MVPQTDVNTSSAKLTSGFNRSNVCKIWIQENNLILLRTEGIDFFSLVLPREFSGDVYSKSQVK